MPQTDERRVVGEKRISLEKVVDVCVGETGRSGAFQARSLDISGRGMHLRTDLLPDLNSPLVFRFHAAGGEVLAQGEVVWHSEGDQGCDFGVQFTALDKGSAKALGKLCGNAEPIRTLGHCPAETSTLDPVGEITPTAWTQVRPISGHSSDEVSAVRLHIEGMAEPLRAEIRQAGPGRLSVGSSLEFLSIGSAVEVEEVKTNRRHMARIGDVNVRVDPESRVPELLVSVRYPKDSGILLGGPFFDEPRAPKLHSPQPKSHLSPNSTDQPTANSSTADGAMERDASTSRSNDGVTGPQSCTDDRASFDDEHDEDGDEREETGPLQLLGRSVSDSVQWAACQGGRVGGLVRDGAGWATRRIRRMTPEGSQDSSAKPAALRRTTAALPRSVNRERARRQGLRFEERNAARSGKKGKAIPRVARKLAVVAALALLVAGAWYRQSGPTNGQVEELSLAKSVSQHLGKWESSVGEVSAAVGAARVTKASGSSSSEFAPQKHSPTMATPDGKAVEVRSVASVVPKKADVNKPGSKPPTIFSRGRLHAPFIHEIRLDQPGIALFGKSTLTGFEVRIPDRKALDSGKKMLRKDPRIANVRISNRGGEAKISVQFHRAIPAYKVRLRKGRVQLFISE